MKKKTDTTKRDVELLFELGAFRFIERTWRQFFGVNVQNCAEHTFKVAWIATVLAKHEKDVDMEKLLRIALVHDISESRCGDVHYLSRQYVKRDEKLAMEDIFSGTSFGNEMKELIEEYEKRDSLESKIVKDADNLDVHLEIKEICSRGHTIGKTWKAHREQNVYPKLYTTSARKFWKAISKADPFSWHNDSPRNRFRGGDWKKKLAKR